MYLHLLLYYFAMASICWYLYRMPSNEQDINGYNT